MGIPGLINELGSGHRISFAKFCIEHLSRHSRPPRIAIDVSIWLFQAQAGRGGANPELRTLFYRLARMVALPVHPLFVFDGSQKPEYKRGKLVCRSENAAAFVVRHAKRLIELFRFPWHAAPGEAEAECAMLQTEGVVDAVMSDDVDAVMFGSKVTMRNFSREASSGNRAATHVNVCRIANTPDGEANVALDQGGMILFAMLSGGDYLPAGVSRCGPKLAGEIARARFGADLLEIVRENKPNKDQQLGEWRERLRYELQENESGYFRNKHKAVQIPDSFPDPRLLYDYVRPVTSTRAQLKKMCGSWVWDGDLDIHDLRDFLCEELGWNYLLGARRLIRTVAPQLVAQRLRLGCPIVPNNTGVRILRRRENFGVDGMSELKLQFIPADVVGLDLEPMPSQESELVDVEEVYPEVGSEENGGTSHQLQQQSYDPTQPDSAWISEYIVAMGLPDLVASWHAEQKKKKSSKSSGSKKSATKKKRAPKVVDPEMTPGAILRFGRIVKGPVNGNVNTASPKSNPVLSQKSPDFVELSPTGCSQIESSPTARLSRACKSKGRPDMGNSDRTSSNVEAAMNFDYNEEGISRPSSPAMKFKDPNKIHSSARSIGRLAASMTEIPISPPRTCPSSPSPRTRHVDDTLKDTTCRSVKATPKTTSRRSSITHHKSPTRAEKALKQHSTQSQKSKNTSSRNCYSNDQGLESAIAAELSLTERSNRDDAGETSRRAKERTSGIIETHGGSWKYTTESKDEDTNSTQQAVDRGTEVNTISSQSRRKGESGKPKRVARVSIYDLT